MESESLVERMLRYARLKGLHVEEKPFSISLMTQDGSILTIYKEPSVSNCGNRMERIFGEIRHVYNERSICKYITEPTAEYLYKLLEVRIAELEKKER